MSWLYFESYLAQRPWLCILLTGLGLALSFPPFPFPFIAWIALIPLLVRWRYVGSSKMMWSEAYTAFLVMAAGAFSWPLLHVLPLTAVVSLVGIMFIPLLMSIPFALSVIVRRWFGLVPGFLSLVLFFLAYEYLMSRGPFAFPWLLLGHTHAEAIAFNQIVDVTGVSGLSLWILLLNGLGMLLLTAYRPATRLAAAFMFLVLLVLPPLYTHWRLPQLADAGDRLAVGYVQPAISPLQWSDVGSEHRVDVLLSVSDSLLAHSSLKPAIVMWPETSLPVLHNQVRHDALYSRLQNWADEHDVSLLTGAITLRHDERRPFGHRDRDVEYHNSALLFRPGKNYLRYDKNYLVPFAEGVPFADQISALKRLALPSGGVSGYRRGASADPLQAGFADIGTLICFESVFGDYARGMIGSGADFLVVLAQNGWWGDTPGYRQYFAFSKLRAIEVRRPVVHVNVSAVSAVVHPNGRVTDVSPWMSRTGTVTEIRLPPDVPTFYVRHGDIIGRIATYLAAVLLLVTGISLRYARGRYGKHSAFRHSSEPRVFG